MKRRFFGLAVVFCIMINLLIMMPAVVSAASSGSIGQLKWTLDDAGTLTIKGTGEMSDFYSYSSAPWYSVNSSIKRIVIESGVKSIGDYAFYGCANVTSVTIPDSVYKIGTRSFDSCSALKSVRLPDNLKTVGYYSFEFCSSLTEIIIPDSVTLIGHNAFYKCRSLNYITVPDSVTTIGELAFTDTAYYNNTDNWEDGVLYIGNQLIKAKTEISGSYSIKENTVTIADEAFFRCADLTEVLIADSVVSIGEESFYGCSGLTEVAIPDSVTVVDKGAFYGCSSLKEVSIARSVEDIGGSVFWSCNNLVNINVDAENEFYCSVDGVLFSKDMTDLIKYPCQKTAAEYIVPDGVINIRDRAFENCSTIKNVIMPDSVTDILSYAFHNCTSLTEITFGDKMDSIGDSAFYGCSALTNVYYKGSEDDWSGIYINYQNTELTDAKVQCNSDCGENLVWRIDEEGTLIISGTGDMDDYSEGGAPWNSVRSTITGLVIGEGVTSIGSNAFYYCKNLTDVVIPDNIVEIKEGAFKQCIGLKSVVIPESVTRIEQNTFYQCSSLESVVIPKSVTSIGKQAFWYCTSLADINLSDNITSIGYDAFYRTKYYDTEKNWEKGILYIDNHLVDVKASENNKYNVKDGTITIVDEAFNGWSSVTAITLPDSVKYIGDKAFYSCAGLTEIVIPDSVISIGNNSFCYCSSLTSVKLPENLTNMGSHAFYGCKSLTEVIIPDEVTSIGDFAFYGCESLTELIIPDGVTSIGSSAFYGCKGLTELIIPDKVTSIGGYAFGECYNLQKMIIPESVTSLGGWLFYECRNLAQAVLPDNITQIADGTFYCCYSLKTVVIPDNVTSIGSSAFYKSGIEEITIPANVVSIGNSAFDFCEPNVICYQGTADEWENVYVANNNDILETSTLAFITTFKFYANGGSEVGNIVGNYVESAPVTTREGYTFLEWYAESYFYSGPASFPVIGSKNAPTVFYAQWQANDYTVTFDAGEYNLSSKTVTYDSTYGTMPTPTKEGYTFVGWYKDNGNRVTELYIVTTPRDHTLTARWEAAEYTVTFDARGGECSVTSKAVTYNSPYGELPVPQRAGYTFVGWTTSANEKITSESVVKKTQNHTLYAKWEIILDNADAEYMVTDVKATLDGSNVNTEAKIKNSSDYGEKALLVVAVYQDGEMVDIARRDIEVPVGDTVTVTESLTGGSGAEVKAFVIDSITTLESVSNVFETIVK